MSSTIFSSRTLILTHGTRSVETLRPTSFAELQARAVDIFSQEAQRAEVPDVNDSDDRHAGSRTSGRQTAPTVSFFRLVAGPAHNPAPASKKRNGGNSSLDKRHNMRTAEKRIRLDISVDKAGKTSIKMLPRVPPSSSSSSASSSSDDSDSDDDLVHAASVRNGKKRSAPWTSAPSRRIEIDENLFDSLVDGAELHVEFVQHSANERGQRVRPIKKLPGKAKRKEGFGGSLLVGHGERQGSAAEEPDSLSEGDSDARARRLGREVRKLQEDARARAEEEAFAKASQDRREAIIHQAVHASMLKRAEGKSKGGAFPFPLSGDEEGEEEEEDDDGDNEDGPAGQEASKKAKRDKCVIRGDSESSDDGVAAAIERGRRGLALQRCNSKRTFTEEDLDSEFECLCDDCLSESDYYRCDDCDGIHRHPPISRLMRLPSPERVSPDAFRTLSDDERGGGLLSAAVRQALLSPARLASGAAQDTAKRANSGNEPAGVAQDSSAAGGAQGEAIKEEPSAARDYENYGIIDSEGFRRCVDCGGEIVYTECCHCHRNYKAEAEMPGTGERAPCPMCGCGVEHADSYQLYTCCNEECGWGCGSDGGSDYSDVTKLQDVSDEDDEQMNEIVGALGRGDCTIDEELGCTEHPYGHNAEIEYGDPESPPAPSESSETEAEFTPREGASADLGQVHTTTADNEEEQEEEGEEQPAIKQEERDAGSGDAAPAGTAGSPSQSAVESAFAALLSAESEGHLSPRTRRVSTRSPSQSALPHSPAAGGAAEGPAENDHKPALVAAGHTPQLPLSRSGSTSGDSDLVYMGVKARPSPEV